MRIRMLLSLAGASAILFLTAACRTLPDGIDRQAPARSIVGKALEVYGGSGSYHALHSLRKEATVTYLSDREAKTGHFLLEYVAPDRLRIEGEAGDRRVVQVRERQVEHEWVGEQETGREIAQELDRRLEAMFILGHFEGGEALGATLTGTPRVSGHATAALTLERAGTAWTIYIDLETYLLRRIREQVSAPTGTVIIDTYLDDHRFVAGRPFAYHFVTVQNGTKVQEARVTRIEVDPEIPPGRFRRP